MYRNKISLVVRNSLEEIIQLIGKCPPLLIKWQVQLSTFDHINSQITNVYRETDMCMTLWCWLHVCGKIDLCTNDFSQNIHRTHYV